MARLHKYQGKNSSPVIARTSGPVAHVIEEQSRKKPMRHIDPANRADDGPSH